MKVVSFMKINIKYMLAFIILLITETFIALFINDTIIRPYIGDILVIILMYTLIKAFIQKSIKLLPVYLFFFCFSSGGSSILSYCRFAAFTK